MSYRFVLVALLAVTSAQADTIFVDDDNCPGGSGTEGDPFCLIQDAIDAAQNGDEVVVADGVYIGPGNRDLDFSAKLITLRSENGPDNCSINCQFEARALHFHSGETADARVEGFTIANGSFGSPGGGAIYCIGSSPTIINCFFLNNRCLSSGGGAVRNDLGSSPVFTDCTFTSNRAELSSGGAISNGDNCNPTFSSCTFDSNIATVLGRGGAMISNSSPSLINCTFVNNRAEERGGAVYFGGGKPTITDCTFNGNSSRFGGGGMYLSGGSVLLVNCTFANNEVDTNDRGGGIYGTGTTMALVNCAFRDNFSDGGGGGLFTFNSTSAFANCAFSGNSGSEGGAIGLQSSDITMTNCTLSDNAGNNGGALHLQNSSATVVNSVLWGNSPDQIAGTPTVTYSNIEGGFGGEGNIDADPVFVDPDNGDYHLSPGSPCIDAADNTAVPKRIDTDLDGNPRFVDDPDTEDTGNGEPPIVDMGAYEFQVAGCPADLDGSGAVDFGDILAILSAWGNAGGPEDLDGSGFVDFGDILVVLAAWGPCP